MKKIAVLAFALAAACASSPKKPVEDTPKVAPKKLPTAEEVLDRFVEVTGGVEAHKALTGMKQSGTFLVPAQGLSGTFTALQVGNRAAFTLTIPGVGEFQQGSDGETVWEISPIAGARRMSGIEREHFLRDRDPLRDIEWNRYYKEARFKAEGEHEGKPTYIVEMVEPDGTIETRHFDQESGLLVKTEAIARQQGGKTPTTSLTGGYKEFGGVKMPTILEQKAAAAAIRIEITSVEVNPTVDDSVFALPADIQALPAPNPVQ